MSPYVVAKGSRPTTAARRKSVRSGRPSARAAASTPSPASANRIPAPRKGATPSRPTAITTHVLDQTATRQPKSVQTTERGTAREGMTSGDAGRADDRGPGGRDLGGLGRAGRRLRALGDPGALPLRPLSVRGRRVPERLARRLGDDRRAG